MQVLIFSTIIVNIVAFILYWSFEGRISNSANEARCLIAVVSLQIAPFSGPIQSCTLKMIAAKFWMRSDRSKPDFSAVKCDNAD